MKAIFWVRQERHLEQTDWRENDLAHAIQQGAHRHGDTVEIREVADGGEPKVLPCDLVLKIGVKSRNWFRAYNAEEIPYCYFDKGYIRTRAPIKWLDYWRMSVNGHQPLRYIETARHDRRRAKEMQLAFQPWKETRGEAVVVDGSSGKHCYFHSDQEFVSREQLDEHARDIATDLVARIQFVCERPIIYRPKPSWKGARPIDGTEYARGRQGVTDKDFAADLRRAHCVITYGSNLCFDAACFGIPSIVLGEGIAKPISSTELDEIESPRLASDAERQQWLNNCAWCQFKLDEFRSGIGWQVIKDMVEVTHG